MPVQASDVKSGAYFLAENHQLRKVIKIVSDAEYRTRVHFMSKSFTGKGQDFAYAQTNRNPFSMERFISECSRVLSQDEIKQLREANIILPDE